MRIPPTIISLSCLLMIGLPAVSASPVHARQGGWHPAETTAAESAEVAGDPETDSAPMNPSMPFMGESAFLMPKGSAAWTCTNIMGHRFDYGVHDHVSISVSTLLPVGILGFAGELKLGAELAEDVHGSISVQGAGLSIFVADGPMRWAVGGGPTLTLGSRELHLDVAVRAYALGTGFDATWATMPTVGGSWQVADTLILRADVGPVFSDIHGIDEGLWVLKYGVRIFGDHWYGDIGLLLPLHDSYFGSVGTVMPLGLPVLSLGYAG